MLFRSVQAAISGISAIVQPDGRVTQRTPLFENRIVIARVPVRTGETPYVRYGALILPASAAVLLSAGAIAWRRRRIRASQGTVDEGAVQDG